MRVMEGGQEMRWCRLCDPKSFAEQLLNGGQVHGHGNADVSPLLLPSLVTNELFPFKQGNPVTLSAPASRAMECGAA